VQWSSEGAFVWVVRDDKAARVPVIIRQRNSDQVLIDGDLKPGELVVIEGVQSLRPGTDVSVKSKAAAKSAALPTAKL
jgi:multidrug efflux pump subunit AcrA (membrane-fusion protein)